MREVMQLMSRLETESVVTHVQMTTVDNGNNTIALHHFVNWKASFTCLENSYQSKPFFNSNLLQWLLFQSSREH